MRKVFLILALALTLTTPGKAQEPKYELIISGKVTNFSNWENSTPTKPSDREYLCQINIEGDNGEKILIWFYKKKGTAFASVYLPKREVGKRLVEFETKNYRQTMKKMETASKDKRPIEFRLRKTGERVVLGEANTGELPPPKVFVPAPFQGKLNPSTVKPYSAVRGISAVENDPGPRAETIVRISVPKKCQLLANNEVVEGDEIRRFSQFLYPGKPRTILFKAFVSDESGGIQFMENEIQLERGQDRDLIFDESEFKPYRSDETTAQLKLDVDGRVGEIYINGHQTFSAAQGSSRSYKIWEIPKDGVRVLTLRLVGKDGEYKRTFPVVAGTEPQLRLEKVILK